ncbi:MAG: hypothetical protein ABII06_01955 [Pseudomonadota bacterium]
MARKETALLDVGDPFPEMNLQPLSGDTLSLPEAAGPGYGVFLIYRGHW